MLKQVLLGSSALMLLFASSVSAQGASELQPQERNLSQEQSSPAPAAPQQQVDPQVDQEELQRFAKAVEQIQAIEQAAQSEINQVLEQSGFSRERFGELYQAQQSPDAGSAEATPEEQQSFSQAVTQIESILQGLQADQVEAIQAEGLEPQRFSEILAAVRQDPTLQQQVQQMLSN